MGADVPATHVSYFVKYSEKSSVKLDPLKKKYIYGSGHEGAAVLLPGFAMKKPGNKTAAPSWPDPYIKV